MNEYLKLCSARPRVHVVQPADFEDWSAVLDYLDTCRVDMMEDTCAELEGCL